MASSPDPNEQRTGVRTPIVLVVLIGVAAIAFGVYTKKDDISIGPKRSGGSFVDVCRGLTPGTPAFEAKQRLVAAGASGGQGGKPPDVRVDGARMLVKVVDPASGGRAWSICTIDLDQSGKAVARAQPSTKPLQ